ncbi:MAG: hypothetical protein MGF17_12810 [Trichodesmium sp. MAG_R04]|nr:hypothetical protein [Trichodesmium sp. MAG_R04]
MNQDNTTIEERRFDDIQTWMSTGQGTNLPEVLQGIYFMDGNKLAEDCLTLSACTSWNSETLTLSIRPSDPLQWTFEPSNEGRKLIQVLKSSRTLLNIRFQDNTFRKADVIPSFYGIQMPTWIFVLEMNQTEDSVDGMTWNRNNRGFFRLIPLGGYILRKIIDKNGQKTPAFDNMLAKVLETCIVVTQTNH